MESTCLTVGGFSQPCVVRTLIEQPDGAGIGLSQRFLWLFPKPSYARYKTLEAVDEQFSDSLGEDVLHVLWSLWVLVLVICITIFENAPMKVLQWAINLCAVMFICYTLAL